MEGELTAKESEPLFARVCGTGSSFVQLLLVLPDWAYMARHSHQRCLVSRSCLLLLAWAALPLRAPKLTLTSNDRKETRGH